jgi:pSer/pThr/pTyr-binding forkhead associated (FHA) protein
MSERITVFLLDPTYGDAVQKWEFDKLSEVRIGRDASNEIVLTDAVVSRLHAKVFRAGKGWSVMSLGKNGVLIRGKEITGATPIEHETVMRIASGGPYLEFRVGAWLDTPAQRAEARKRWAETASERPQIEGTIDLKIRKPRETTQAG